MDIDTKFFDLFSCFIRDIGKTYPETKQCLYRNYSNYLDDDCVKSLNDEKIKKFINVIHENHDLITNKNEQFFEKDIEYLDEISFSNLWKKNISEKTKKIFWKYLQSFALISINIKSTDALSSALDRINDDNFSKDILKDKEVAKNLSEIKKLTTGIKEEINDDNNDGDFEDMIGGLMDTNIGSIAKEVTESVNMEQMFGKIDDSSNPMDIISNMMNPEKMNEIFASIGAVVDKKKETGEFTEESLKNEAEGLYGQMGKNPLFSNLMQGMMPPAPEPEPEPENSDDNKDKLRQKLREKRQARERS